MSRTLFRHNRIWTGDTGRSGNPWTDALLVEDGRIVAIGAEAVETAEAAGDAECVDLPGAVVMPGLHDAHIHTEWLSRDLSSVDLREARSLEEALELVRAHAEGLPDDEWLHSGRWNHNRWAVPVQPDRHALDSVSGDRVAALSSVDGHTIWANSLALQRAGITRDTPDPVGGEIVRDASGEPTGILRESAQELLDVIPRDESPLRPWLERCQDWLLSVGLTSITDIDGEDARAAYAELHADGALRLRVTKCTRDPDLELAIAEGRRSGQGDDVFRVGPVKFFSDGALGSHTAHMTEPFIGHEGCGIAAMPYDVLLERTLLAARNGLDVVTHAIGDEANRLVLGTFEAVRAEGLDTLLRIEHAQHVLPVDVPRFRSLDVVASMQPSHCTADLELADEIIGPRRLASYAWRTFLDAGVRVAFGSDAPVEDPNPFYGLHAAVTRQRPDAQPLGGWRPEEKVTLTEAVHAFTVAAHESVGRTDVGRLVPGQLADLVAVDRDLWALEESSPADIRDTVVLQTWVGGELVHERS
ncbi:amidohydrolase [Terrabacter tumescens]|uniref:Amidohydrolase n=1 Tax=Terrabacter tumescens TaxID=60443 RepID=A0ABQ2I1I6_9MICO|nr:amidohydrolase [Terrabacter tumescens]GGM97758.1 amidohydrolase [Terrabacter tumescens]